MSRADHQIDRFQGTMGDSWWWRRKADLIDRKQEDGTYKPFDFQAAGRMMMTRRNKRRFERQMRLGLPIEVRMPYKVPPIDAPAPPMAERDPGMTRQAQRRLYRETCKLSGVPWRKLRTEWTPRMLRGMTAVQRALWEEAQWQEYKAEMVRFEESVEKWGFDATMALIAEGKL